MIWCMLVAATGAFGIWYLYLKAVDNVDQSGAYWVKVGLAIFMLWALTVGNLDYYFATLIGGNDRVHQLEKTVELSSDSKLVLYWCIGPPLSPCILILAIQKQLPFGMVLEKNLHNKEGSTECTLSVEGNTAHLKYDSKSFNFPLETEF
ncbi:MAG: hypothetical protein C0469_16275 [Cyanobacteria bacterium DS2.3.42]|nr:hypothetical protein [Cyanobacteria bacterium DS2.3.42]